MPAWACASATTRSRSSWPWSASPSPSSTASSTTSAPPSAWKAAPAARDIARLDARHHLAREGLGEAPLLVHAGGEYELLQALTLEVADLIDQLVRGADQTRGANQVGVDQLGLARVEVGVMELVGAEVPALGRGLFHESAVPLPHGPEEGWRIDASLVDFVVEVVDAGHDVWSDGANHPVGRDVLAGIEQRDVGESAVAESSQAAAGPRDTLSHVPQGLGHRHAARRDGEHEAVAIFPR